MKIDREVTQMKFSHDYSRQSGVEDPDESGRMTVTLHTDNLEGLRLVTITQNDFYSGEVTLTADLLLEIAAYVKTLTPKPKKGTK